jgi:Chlorophyllase
VRNLYLDPVSYGIDDVTLPDSGTAARVYFPTEGHLVFKAPVRRGTYPLVIFVHGHRQAFAADDVLCPPDVSQDYKAWSAILHLLARCGFVVVSPDVHATLSPPEHAVDVVEEAVRWIHHGWRGNRVLWRPAVFIDPDRHGQRAAASGKEAAGESTGASSTDRLDVTAYGIERLGEGIGVDPLPPGGMTTPVGLAAHSWGARASVLVQARHTIRVSALASVAGSFDSNEAIQALIDASYPTLMIAGTADSEGASYLPPLWQILRPPKHQALLEGLGHWDWFGSDGAIRYCDPDAAMPSCRIGWLLAAELLLTFMTRYLKHEGSLPLNLLGPSGNRVPVRPFLVEGVGPCGLAVRWDAGGSVVGERTFGYSSGW